MKIKNIKTIFVICLAATLLGAQTSFASAGDTISVTGNTVSSSCLGERWVAGRGVLPQYWSVSNADGNASAVAYCDPQYGTNTIDITGFSNGTITSKYYAGDMNFGNLYELVGETSTTNYTGGSAPVVDNGLSLNTSGVMASVGSSTSTTFQGLVPVVIGIAGIYLAFYITKKVIGLIPKSRAKK